MPVEGTKIVDLSRSVWDEQYFNLEAWKRALEVGKIFNVGINLLDVLKSVPFSDQGH